MSLDVSQVALESLMEAPARAETAQSLIEILGENPATNSKISQVVAEIVWSPGSNADVAQCVAEVLDQRHTTCFAAQNVSEVLAHHPSNCVALQTVIEALVDIPDLIPRLPEYIPLSDYLLPSVPGLGWPVIRRPIFSTRIAPHISGSEVRVSDYAYPIWEFELTYDVLRADSVHAEQQSIMGFFLKRSGDFDTFLYMPDDESNTIVARSIGQGDGTTTQFVLSRTYAGFDEPVGYADPASIAIYFNGVQQMSGWSFVSPNNIEFTSAPAIGVAITASYTWYYRVRFLQSQVDFEEFMRQLVQLKKVTIRTVKPIS